MSWAANIDEASRVRVLTLLSGGHLWWSSLVVTSAGHLCWSPLVCHLWRCRRAAAHEPRARALRRPDPALLYHDSRREVPRGERITREGCACLRVGVGVEVSVCLRGKWLTKEGAEGNCKRHQRDCPVDPRAHLLTFKTAARVRCFFCHSLSRSSDVTYFVSFWLPRWPTSIRTTSRRFSSTTRRASSPQRARLSHRRRRASKSYPDTAAAVML